MHKKIIDTAFRKDQGTDVQLWNYDMDDQDFKYALQKDTKKIKRLELYKNKLTQISLKRMTNYKWQNIEILSIGMNRIGDKGCKYLSRLNMPKLFQLNLTWCGIKNIGLSHLTKAQWNQLRIIYLNINLMNCDGLKNFCTSKWHQKLNQIWIDDNVFDLDQICRLIFLECRQVTVKWTDYALYIPDQQQIGLSFEKMIPLLQQKKINCSEGSIL